MDAPFPAGMVEEIQRVLALNLSSGLFLYDEIFDSPLMFPLQRRGELCRMMEIATKASPKTIMEIGADKGGGLYHWCQLPTATNVIADEIRGLPYSGLFEQAFGERINFLWLPTSSEEAWGHVGGWLSAAQTLIDVLFIDGDKGRFYEDFELYLPLMSEKGIVFFHDVQDPGPMRAAFNKASEDRRHELILDKSDYYAVMGKEPPYTAHEEWLRHWKGRSCGVGVVYLG